MAKRRRTVSPQVAREAAGVVDPPFSDEASAPPEVPRPVLGASSPEVDGHCGYQTISTGEWYEAPEGRQMCAKCGRELAEPGSIMCINCPDRIIEEEKRRRQPPPPRELSYYPTGEGPPVSPAGQIRAARYSKEQEAAGRMLARYFGDEPKPRRLRGGD